MFEIESQPASWKETNFSFFCCKLHNRHQWIADAVWLSLTMLFSWGKVPWSLGWPPWWFFFYISFQSPVTCGSCLAVAAGDGRCFSGTNVRKSRCRTKPSSLSASVTFTLTASRNINGRFPSWKGSVNDHSWRSTLAASASVGAQKWKALWKHENLCYCGCVSVPTPDVCIPPSTVRADFCPDTIKTS